VSPAELAALENTLSPHERAQFASIRRGEARRQAIVSRGLLRRLLSRYLGVRPEAVALRTGKFGKLALRRQPGSKPLNFSVSHSGDTVAFAFCEGAKVGIDIESVGREIDFREIADAYFLHSERSHLEATPKAQRSEEFYRIWTAKEACLKAMGIGLAASLQSFEVRFRRLASGASRPQVGGSRASRYHLSELSLGEGLIATLACAPAFPIVHLRAPGHNLR
jgi:4'-phosphopantetheinyl transferase